MSTLYGKSVEINLTELNFPFLSTTLPLGSVVKELPDQSTSGKFASGVAPQLVYAKNILPTQDGYSSLDRFQVIAAAAVPPGEFQHYFTFTTVDGADYLGAELTNRFAYTRTSLDTWHYIALAGQVAATQITRAFVNGEQYFYFSQLAGYKFNYLANPPTLDVQPFTGLPAALILGISSASGYLLAFSSTRVYWDSPQARGNFTPAIGGADSQQIEALRGNIVAVLPLANGFVIYSSKNAVAAQYTGNPNKPWTFREIPRSSGIRNQYNVAWSGNLTSHYAWTYSGLQEVSFTKAENAWPFLTEFINKQTLEAFSFTSGVASTTSSTIFAVKLELIGHRYLAISYGNLSAGTQIFAEALIYDIDLERWGKLVAPHVSLVNFNLDVQSLWLSYSDVDASATRTYAALATKQYQDLTKTNGGVAIQTSNIGSGDILGNAHFYLRTNPNVPITSTAFTSALVFGRIAFLKTQVTQFHQIQLQNIAYIAQAALYYSLTSDPFQDSGITLQRKTLFQRDLSPNVRRFQARKTAKSFGFALEGRFELSNLIFQLQQGAKR